MLITHEILHALKKKHLGKKGWMALKLDMSKAYDRVEWDYLENVMARMGFEDMWIRKTMMCDRSVTFRISINGNDGNLIFSGRGLRQGDPISLYLFLLCMEGFSALLSKSEEDGNIQGVSICRGLLKSPIYFLLMTI